MKQPLIRQGTGMAGAISIHQDLVEKRRELDRMIDTANATSTEQDRRYRGLIAARSAAGDEHRLRMIPVYARGVPGVIPGTQPGHGLR